MILAAALVTLLQVIPLSGDTFHVQGIVVDGDTLYLTSVHRPARQAWLFEYDLATGQRRRALPIEQGDAYHPGGFDHDAHSLWIPLAEYRPGGRTIIQRREMRSLALLSSFPVSDHIGCLAVTPSRLFVFRAVTPPLP